MVRSACCCRKTGTSGGGAIGAVAAWCSRGRSCARVFSSISIRGFAGCTDRCNCTIFGRLGKIFGGSSGALGFMSVWRGCVGCTASVNIRWRGWKAAASGTWASLRTMAALARRAGSVGALERSGSGRSLTGPDQVSSVLLNAGFWRIAVSHRGNGTTTMARCSTSAMSSAKRGTRPSIQPSLKNPW